MRDSRHGEPLDQALRVALMLCRGERDRRLALGREHLDLARHAQRIEQQQPLTVGAAKQIRSGRLKSSAPAP
jgi:hypothetical protein